MGKGKGLDSGGQSPYLLPRGHRSQHQHTRLHFQDLLALVSLLSGLRSKFRCPEASPPSNAQRGLPIADLLKAGVCFGAHSGRFSLVLGN